MLPFSLMLITDLDRTPDAVTAQLVGATLHAVDASRVAIVVRGKSRRPPDTLIAQLSTLCAKHGSTLVLHGATSRGGAWGHVPGHVRGPYPPRTGASRHPHDPTTALQGLTYAWMSPYARPTSKPGDTRQPLGFAGLRAQVRRAPCPLIALGGLTPSNAGEARRAGAAGIAVLGGWLAAPHPPSRARALLDAWRAAR